MLSTADDDTNDPLPVLVFTTGEVFTPIAADEPEECENNECTGCRWCDLQGAR